MSALLPLYPEPPVQAIQSVVPLGLDRGCTRCALHEGVRSVCLSAEGEPGGLLVVGEGPGKQEDREGRPFFGKSGELLRRMLAKHWKGPVALDNAMRCYPGGREIKDKYTEECRGYLAATIDEVKPERVVALGGWAAYSLTGRSVAPLSARRGYTYMYERDGRQVPIFFVMHPAAALRNRFLREWFEQDLVHALNCPLPDEPPIETNLRIVETTDDARAAIASLEAAPWSAFDVETAGIMHNRSFRMLVLSLSAVDTDVGWTWSAEALRDERCAPLRTYLADARRAKLGQNVKYDALTVELTLGLRVAGIAGDVRLWRKLVEPEADGKLDKMAELVGMGGMKEEAREAMREFVELIQKGVQYEKRVRERAANPEKKWPKLTAKAQTCLAALAAFEEKMPDLAAVMRLDPAYWERWGYAVIPKPMLYRYNGRDSVATARLGKKLRGNLAAEVNLERVWQQVVKPAERAIQRVEQWGVLVDRGAIQAFDRHLDGKLAEVKQRLAVHGEVNPDSPKQVGDLLFKKLGLKPIKMTPSGQPSTDNAVLEALASKHPVANDIHHHRTFAKLKGTYAAGMIEHIREDSRIHTSILLDGAGTGRTSSSDPNLQNIPRAKDSLEGKMARDCFVAPPGFTLVQLDYSQLELRIAAALSGDPLMKQIFLAGIDYHQRTAELISKIAWGIDPSTVESKHRSIAKTVNFGILYGKTVRTFAKDWGVSVEKAQAIVDAILGNFKVFAAWSKEQVRALRKTGYVYTWWDGQIARRRPLYRVADQDSEDDYGRINAENSAVNTPIQGTASDFCVRSLAACVEWIEEERIEDVVKLVLPVHDSLLFEVRNDYVEETIHTARTIMTGWNSNGVPLVVDVEVGQRWGSLSKAA